MMLSLDTAYRSFGGEVEASSTPTICRLPDSRRHQLSAIAPIGEAEIILTRTLKQFRLDNVEVCCGLQNLVRAMILQGCRKADRAEVVERDRFATPNSLKSHGERNLLSPISNTCAITPK